MLQDKIKKAFIPLMLAVLVVGGLTTSLIVNADEEVQDTVQKVTFKDPSVAQKLYENDNFTFSYRKETTCFEILDKRNNYTWSSGLNLTSDENKEQGRISSSYLEFANSFIETKTIIDKEGTIVFSDSGDSGLADIEFYKVNNDNKHYCMDITFKRKFKATGDKATKLHDLYTIRVHIYFNDLGMDVEIRNEEIQGEYRKGLKDLYLMPFLASEGGTIKNGDSTVLKDMENGYILVPDGSGSLVNFQRNVTAYKTYNCDIYGGNPGYASDNVWYPSRVVENKPCSLPLYGCARLDDNAAFVAYAETGSENMYITVEPESGGEYPLVQSLYAYPKFTYNFLYTEYYNKTGANNRFARLGDILDYDINMSYEFLANEDANYSGMAKAYQRHLISEGKLERLTYDYNELPIRLDFLMADSEYSVMGKEEVVVTSVEQVDNILDDVYTNLEIKNIVASLQGWAKGGRSANDPRKVYYSSKIGTKREYKNLLAKYKELGVDVALAQDYLNINDEQMSFVGNATKHVNKYYNEAYREVEFTQDYAFARSDKYDKWVKTQNKKLIKDINLNSMTIEGISDSLVSHSQDITLTETLANTQKTFEYLDNSGIKVNASHPHNYLFEYVDRYFNIPVTDSQYLIENNEVPFLEMVLQGCLEMYTDYSNFSFYNQNSILTMIDYNVSPSFILTNESSHLLTYTNSADYYSTEYTLYRDKIDNIYAQVNDALSQVINDEWLYREYKDGVYINTYKSGKKIYINYTLEDKVVDGVEINKESYEVR